MHKLLVYLLWSEPCRICWADCLFVISYAMPCLPQLQAAERTCMTGRAPAPGSHCGAAAMTPCRKPASMTPTCRVHHSTAWCGTATVTLPETPIAWQHHRVRSS